MKIIKRVVFWIIISISVQCAGLFYVNNYFLSEQTSYKSKKVVTTAPKKSDVEVNIPDSSKNINASYDGKYVAYYQNDVLKVVNTKTAQTKNVEFGDGVKVSFYKWLPDRNRMLIAEKTSSKSGSGFMLSYYDVDKDAKDDIKNLTWADSKSEVEDIQASTLTNVIYVKVAHSGKRSSIYWINIMKEMKKVDTISYLIGNIRSIPHDDRLVYEDLTYHRILATNVKKPLSINGVDNPCLLDVDNDDNIYIGQVINNKVVKIYSGTLKEDTSKWKVTALKEPADKGDILINENGKIYIHNVLKGILKEVDNGKETSYKGTIIGMYSDGIASVSDGKLVKTTLK